MFAKVVFVFCVQTFLVHVALSQCVHPGANYLQKVGTSSCGVNSGLGITIGAIPSRACTLPVTCFSASDPVGLSLASENICEGSLALFGELPFLSTVGVNGVLPSAGAGAVNYGCGNGNTAITSGATPVSVGGCGTPVSVGGCGY